MIDPISALFGAIAWELLTIVAFWLLKHRRARRPTWGDVLLACWRAEEKLRCARRSTPSALR